MDPTDWFTITPHQFILFIEKYNHIDNCTKLFKNVLSDISLMFIMVLLYQKLHMPSHWWTKLTFVLEWRKDRKKEGWNLRIFLLFSQFQAIWRTHYQHCPSGFLSIYFYNHFLWTNLSNHADKLKLFHISTTPRCQHITVNITCLPRNHHDLAKSMLIFPFNCPHSTKLLPFISVHAKN